MARDKLDYGRLMQKALRRLLAEVLGQVAEQGLPGDHHFYITFDTTHPGVDLPGHLRAKYPEQMTIVLQEWFEDLAVAGDRFSVTLSFGGVPQGIVVPFDAILTFVDPSVEFGLRFDSHDSPGPEDPGDGPDGASDEAESADDAPEPHAGGDVVRLDRFRRH
ncbi:MAG: hypothetical protein KatS3mg118_1074 [Paracoccaceae bacterium]|nr:MAG: hypothetical protein KatS3mg118_1074 [Paracoccaceae bacterium]